tara:strand:+ start:2034 stop:2531 length:498 start_codon:yes stop_codon:yes gene_type:complete
MAELATVYGNGDNGINNGQQPNQLSNSLNGGNMRDDNNQYNSPDVYNQPQQQESGTQEVDAVIEKMQERIDKQKKINELKEEMKKTKTNNDSIIDRYLKKKKDVLKLFALALLILLALSMNDLIKTYLGKYLLSNDLTDKNEMYLRLSVPLTIYFVIWTMKAFSK